MKTYKKQEEINKAKEELFQVREDMKKTEKRLNDYNGQSEDQQESARLTKEQIRLVDLIDELKDAG